MADEHAPTYDELKRRLTEVEAAFDALRKGQVDSIAGDRGTLETRLAEKAVREREEYLQAILRTTPDGFWVIDRKGRVVEVNDTYCAMSGYERNEILGMAIGDLDAEEEQDETAARIRRIVANGYEVFETSHRRKDGSVFPVEISTSFLQEHGGRFVCFCRNLSERHEREERIAQLARMLDAAPAAITVHDTEGRFLFANRATLFLHGYDSESEFLSVNLHDLDLPESEEKVEERVRRIAETGETRFEVAHYRKDGSTFPLEILAKAIVWHGQPAILSIATDISERKQTEAQLRLQSLVLNQIADCVTVTDLDGVITYVNEAEIRGLGHSREELLGKSTIVYGEDAQRGATQRRIVEETLRSGHWRGEVVNYTVDGRELILDCRTQVVVDESGKKVALCGVATDITERVRTEKALRESEQKYRALFDTFPLGITISDRSGKIVETNDTACKLLGVSREEHEARTIDGDRWALIRPDGSPMPSDEYPSVRALKERRLVENVEMGIVKEGDEITWISVTAAPLLLEEYGVVVTYGDITKRKEAEKAFAESHALLENLARLVPGVVYQYRLYPDGRSVFPYASPGMKDIYEVTPQQVREDATPVFGRLHPDDREMVGEAISESARTLETFYCEFRVVLPRQGLRWRWSQAQPQRMEDGSTLWHGIISDITDRKEAEREREHLREQLAQAQKMESIGRLAGGVAHDFNNMLNVILGHAELMLDDLPPGSLLRASLDEIRKAGVRSADLTRQLLAFARKQTVAPKVLNLNQTVESMLKMLERLIGEDIDLLWKPAPSLQPIRIDPAQIDQILANLIVNARDAIGHAGGKVAIETASAAFDDDYCALHPGFAPGDYAMLAVSDNGCGMDEATKANIFEPFFTTKNVGEGTGLGLATVYGIVKQNNGFINAYSEPGEGSTLSIYLPVHATSEAAPTRARNGDGPLTGGNETILLVEDEPAILTMARKMLEKMGYTVLPASTPGQAIRLAREHAGQIHLLITDVVMPEMNGRDLAANLLSLYPDLKRLFMSGYTANVIAHHGVLDEGVNFIQKPFSTKDLSDRVHEALGHQPDTEP